MTPWLESFQKMTQLSNEELMAVMEMAKPTSFNQGEFFNTPDKTCTQIAVLQSGIGRVYHLHDGKEITDYFNTTSRNPLVSSFVSFLKRKPSREYVQFLTDSEVLVINYDQLQELYNRFPSFERLGRLMAERNYLLALERIESLQYHSASQRYESFLKLYPGLMNQIPHHYVASYLGITPESLSRIRKNFASD